MELLRYLFNVAMTLILLSSIPLVVLLLLSWGIKAPVTILEVWMISIVLTAIAYGCFWYGVKTARI